jgi:uncharacterized protein YeaO (DUF488 family)
MLIHHGARRGCQENGAAPKSGRSIMPKMSIKRIYDQPSPEDGFRVLVDRIWPRGMSKADAAIDLWEKDIAPSTALRKWFHHERPKWEAFQEKYRAELEEKTQMLRDLLTRAGDRPMTLLYSAKDTKYNQAVVLKDVLEHLSRR